MMFYDGLADKVRAEEWKDFIKTETDRLNLFLLQSNVDKQTAIENITDDVLSGYYDERRKVDTKSRDCEHRKIMLAYEFAVCDVIAYIRNRIKIDYTENYITKWATRIGYFPFEALMRTGEAEAVEPKYKTIPRTHRIAAVWGLIDKLQLRASQDKTTLAAFVEAVTGGNIEIKPKDALAYKEPEPPAKAAAVELLKKIGIE